MKRNYEKPIAELVKFEVAEDILDVTLEGSMPGLEEGEEDY